MKRQEALKTAKPILFNTEMVKAILDGKKKVTRRVIKPQPKSLLCYAFMGANCGKWIYPSENTHKYWGDKYKLSESLSEADMCIKWTPPFHTDDILYVRETWCKYDNDHVVDGQKYAYRADATLVSEEARKKLGYKWKPSIHMPKEATRIFLRVTDVRVERLQDMTEDDAFREGWRGPWCEHKVFENYPDSPIPCMAAASSECPKDPPCDHSVPELFGTDIWNETIKKSDLDRYGWQANPWVWVISFERIEVE